MRLIGINQRENLFLKLSKDLYSCLISFKKNTKINPGKILFMLCLCFSLFYSDHSDYSYSANLTLNQMVQGKALRAYVHTTCNDAPCVELFYFNEDTNEVSGFLSKRSYAVFLKKIVIGVLF